ncbi:MAG: sn-glycerol-3-phosphate ABC transporter ATP-binding protein UgpC [Candidatus Hydrogenedentota bacterium]
MASVELKNVSKTFPGGVIALHPADITVAHGEFVVLVGPSGCGKSTALRLIAGLEQPTTGELLIGGRVVNHVEPKDRDIAMVFQNYALYPHMTVYKNLAFGLAVCKVPKAEIRDRVTRAARTLGIEDLLERKPRALSGGQRQRVALGRAIVREPAVFLFDEPLSNLDAQFRVQMRTEITRLHRQLGATMIYVTHDQVEAMTMGSRIVVMREGRIQQAGPPREIYEHPANRFVAGFISSPQMNFIDGELSAANGVLTFTAHGGAFTLPLGPETANALRNHRDRVVTLGIRPEHIHIVATLAAAHFTATIETVELLGADTYVYVRTDSPTMPTDTLVTRVVPSFVLSVGARLSLSFSTENLHFFDGTNGNSVC